MPSRRTLLTAASLALVGTALPRLVAAAPLATERRLVVILLRGGMDGLAAVPPLGDPGLAGLRRDLVPAPADAPALHDGFALHPALAGLKPLYDARELLPVHAVATAYRDRSHFDAQDLLETGAGQPHARRDGWLNRALAAAAPDGSRRLGLAVGGALPLILRGPAPVSSWEPPVLPAPDSGFLDLLARLYDGDPVLAPALAEGVRSADAAGAALGDDAMAPTGQPRQRGVAAAGQVARAAGRLLAAADGARVAVLELGGWDTHAGQAQRIGAPLAALAATITELKAALGPDWQRTALIAVTEFGRTVAANGTRGTDHGTASAALLAGGAIAGGRVLADWPGLAPGQLHEGRDLRPTLELRQLLKPVLQAQLGLSSAVLETSVFPDSAAARPRADILA